MTRREKHAGRRGVATPGRAGSSRRFHTDPRISTGRRKACLSSRCPPRTAPRLSFAAARRAPRAGASSSTSSLGDVASNRRRSSSSPPPRDRRGDPRRRPVSPPRAFRGALRAPTPAQTSASAPWRVPSPSPSSTSAAHPASPGSSTAVTRRRVGLTLGAAVNVSEAVHLRPRPFFPPRELRGLIPTSSPSRRSTFETPQAAFALPGATSELYGKRAGFPPGRGVRPSPRAPNSVATWRTGRWCCCESYASYAAVASSTADSPRAARRSCRVGFFPRHVQARQFAVDESLLAEGGRQARPRVRPRGHRATYVECSVEDASSRGGHSSWRTARPTPCATSSWNRSRSRACRCKFEGEGVNEVGTTPRNRRWTRSGARGIRRARGTRGGSAKGFRSSGTNAISRSSSRAGWWTCSVERFHLRI